ncbi:hypothetical protein [Actinomadura sp. DC4]|uniref:hypothetical protein n=1 Tax=Actinomadura sp. DC4 TaxID=3055069 RepID=UPI0025B168EA|nr:hypothetical protein [Actinomadura sp. DC4]MDN3353469.1 hypothetical protein [Actinomadura sp. DC4]
MTQPFDDEHGDRLRRALHAEAEAVTPSAEGLERIRSKINKKHERRFGFFSYSTPWLRPFAAVAAALAVCVVTVSVTPALANFVQTGHFSPDAGGDGDNSSTKDGRSQGEIVPGGSTTPAPSGSPSPTAIHPTNTGKHVVNGTTCPPGERTVTPPVSPSSDAATPQVTCQAPPGGDTTPPTSTDGPPTQPPTSPPDAPPSNNPTSEAAPDPNLSP